MSQGVRLTAAGVKRLAKTNTHVERRPRGGDPPPRPRFPQGSPPGKVLAFATSGAIAMGATKTVTLAVWTGSAWAAGSETLDVENPWNFTVASGSLLSAFWYYGIWIVDAANC